MVPVESLLLSSDNNDISTTFPPKKISGRRRQKKDVALFKPFPGDSKPFVYVQSLDHKKSPPRMTFKTVSVEEEKKQRKCHKSGQVFVKLTLDHS